MDSKVQRLSRMKIEYENGKSKHENWVKVNQEMAGTKEYVDYIEQFQEWEKQILKEIEQLQASLTRRPIEQAPQLPTQDLDGQLHAMLETISMAKFTAALVELCKQDLTVFKLITDIVNRETKGTGYHNSLLPNANRPGLPAIPPAFPPPLIQLPGTSQPPPFIQQNYLPRGIYTSPSTSSGVPPPQIYQTPTQQYVQTQLTPYGVIPADWTIDEPVKRKEPPPPQKRQYSIKMPFKDFTQS